MDNIIREFDIEEIYIPYTINKSKRKFYEDVIKEVKQKELSINYKKAGDKFELGGAKYEIYRTDMNGTILLINENGTNKVQILDTKVNA